MEGVEVKATPAAAPEAKPKASAKAAAPVKAEPGKVAFMEKRNEARANAGLAPAYSQEQIEALKEKTKK